MFHHFFLKRLNNIKSICRQHQKIRFHYSSFPFSSLPKANKMNSAESTFKLHVIPMFNDNYSYLFYDEEEKVAAVVDPADPHVVLRTLSDLGISLSLILTTHKHHDHAGGNTVLKSHFPDLEMVGHPLDFEGSELNSNISNNNRHHEEGRLVTRTVEDDESFLIGSRMEVQVIWTPCHTRGSVCYLVSHNSNRLRSVLFTGDTLFMGGCGRFFEGTGKQMYDALITKLGNCLHDKTEVYGGHEYTLQNLTFAASVEPGNQIIDDKLRIVKEQRQHGFITYPTTIVQEKAINPFMRVKEASILQATGKTDPIEAMTALRNMKNNFRFH